ncbi:MAG TPA: hypothetical protein VHT29_09900 [Solirubrobacteraceae bacterium]|nr:hypothetical protein [Solirubrobacteraceae bacterium]
MNTVRAARRWIYVRRRYGDVDQRVLMAVAILCVVVFAGAFALGRVTRPVGAPRELGSQGAQLGSASAAVPASLLPAPAVELAQVERASARRASRTSSPASVAVVGASAPATRTSTQSLPAVAPTVAAAPTPQPAPGVTSSPSTPARSGGSAPQHTAPQSSSGTPFDTSG